MPLCRQPYAVKLKVKQQKLLSFFFLILLQVALVVNHTTCESSNNAGQGYFKTGNKWGILLYVQNPFVFHAAAMRAALYFILTLCQDHRVLWYGAVQLAMHFSA